MFIYKGREVNTIKCNRPDESEDGIFIQVLGPCNNVFSCHHGEIRGISSSSSDDDLANGTDYMQWVINPNNLYVNDISTQWYKVV